MTKSTEKQTGSPGAYHKGETRLKARFGTKSILLFLTLCMALLLLTAELLLFILHKPFPEKLWEPTENALARFDEELGWSYIPNLAGSMRFSSGGSRTRLNFSDDGFRTREKGEQIDFDAPSALFIGGSFTMGHGVEFHETFAGQFGEISDGRLQVVNMGVQGYGTGQSLLMLKRHLPKFNKARLVVYTYIDAHRYRASNYDRRILIPQARFLGTKPLFALGRDSQLYLKKRPVRYENYYYSRIWAALNIALPPKRSDELTRAIVLEMKRVTEEQGGRFVVISWPWKFLDTSLPARELPLLTKRYTLFDGTGIDVIDTNSNAPQGWFGWRLKGDPHPSVKAHARVARLLSKRLER